MEASSPNLPISTPRITPTPQDPVSAWRFSLQHPSQAINVLIAPSHALSQSLNPEASGAHTEGASNPRAST